MSTAAAKSLQSCPTLRPHRRQPTRLLCPWDSPSKNTGVGCHFLLQCMKVKSESEVTQLCPTLSDSMDCSLPTRLLRPWDFPGKSTGVGCHCLLRWNKVRQYLLKLNIPYFWARLKHKYFIVLKSNKSLLNVSHWNYIMVRSKFNLESV